VTSHPDEIQRLIADIDNLLANNGKRLSKFLSNQPQEPKEVLESIRNFLTRLGEGEVLSNNGENQSSEQKTRSPLLAKFVEQSNTQYEEQITAALSEKLNTQVSALLKPLQAELTELLQQRATLVQEIRQLEQRRLQNYSLSQQLANQEQIINEFLQVFTNRLVPTLTSQLTQSLANAPKETSDQGATKDLDQRLVSLDGTVNVVFEALERNLQTYQESLSQALARMHSQGVQGEQVMASFVNNLTQYLQQYPGYQPAQPQPELEIKRSPITPPKPEVATITDPLPSPQPATALTPTTPTTLQPASSPVDEVDELYASLFTAEDFTNQVTEVTPAKVTVNEASRQEEAFSFPVDITQTTDLSPTLPELPVESPEDAATLEAILDEPTPATDTSLEWGDLFFEESTQTTSLPSAEVTVTEATESIYTITTLTELFADAKVQPQIMTVTAPPRQVINTTTVTPAAAKPEVVIPDAAPEKSLDNYIPASPQENLLSPEVAATMPEISLDEEQLQLLNQDLANFDGMLNSQSSLITSWVKSNNLNHQEQLEKETATEELTATSAKAIPQVEAELDFSPIIEKKKESTTGDSANSSISPAQNLNHPESAENILQSRWYLGIDLGTTGISATLLNSSTCVVYPIYWTAESQGGASSFPQSFRLPAEVYLPTASVPQTGTENTEADVTAKSPEPVKNTPYSAQLKPYLQLAIPYKSARQKWEPVLQFNEFSAGPLVWVVRSLSKLLLTLKSDRQSTTQGLTAAAVGLDEQSFRTIINNIAGAICTCPGNCPEQYRFNIREALLTSQLVQHPQQVFFIEEAIASLLSVLNAGNGETVQLSSTKGLHPVQINEQPLLGNTLALNIGATATEMALVDLPENLSQFTHHDFMVHSFAYGGKGIEQDIICQLLLPPKSRQSRAEITGDTQSTQPGLWQSNIPGLDQMYWQSLGLEELELPRVGEPDISARVRLQQRLESSLLGQAVLDAALALKLILQHQESFTLDLADQRWVLERRDLESQVLVPFVRRLNRELNKLLVARGIPTEAITQAILTGGVASIATINRWLKQKLPNAKIIQDSYLGENGAPSCSRVAYGLAMLPLHPQVLDLPRQQYTDYFLFTELLRLLPDRPLSFSEIIHLFEARGVNTRTCQQRLLAFLEGELPAGLIPNHQDWAWLTQTSQQNPDYHAIASASLFEKQGNLTYRPNAQQLLLLRQYLQAIKATTRQSLEEPYTLNFALEVAH
jgi:hypothetical protein